jgi:methylmalonyl-CoA mutase cobalamin-binding subunit
VTVGVVRRHERRLSVLAEVLQQYGTDVGSRRLPEEILAEAVADAVFSGGVVGPGNAGYVENLLPLRELVGSHGDG